MVKEKRKNASLSNSSTLAFILLWSASYAVGFEALWLTLEKLWKEPYRFVQVSRDWDVNILFLLLGLAIPGLLQIPLVKRVLRGSPRGWISLTGVGIIIVWVILHLMRVLVLEPRGEKAISLEFLMFALFTPVALAQTIWFAQYVKRAWLWPLVSLIGTVVCLFISMTAVSLSSLVIGSLVYALIMGVTMFYLHIDFLWHSEAFQGN